MSWAETKARLRNARGVLILGVFETKRYWISSEEARGLLLGIKLTNYPVCGNPDGTRANWVEVDPCLYFSAEKVVKLF